MMVEYELIKEYLKLSCISLVNLSGSECMLTPERSIEIQNSIGADIIMQLDDVVSSTVTGPRVEEAMHR